ncbi:MAG: hypothetical protein M3512_00535 [Bacteroidota bacterium]|nr:hypothetical protein [Bacteroidota bacterium]
MTVIHDPIEQEKVALNNEKAFKVLLTGSESNREITSRLSKAGFEVDFLQMEQPLKDASTIFSFKHFQPGIKHAHANGQSLIICIDETTNKVGVAVKNHETGVFQLLNAHQLAALLVQLWQKDYADETLTFVKSIHISEMIELLAAKGGSSYKNIIVEPGSIENEIKALYEGRDAHVFGFTENQEFYDNKVDFITIIEKIISLGEHLEKENSSLFDELLSLYKEYGFYKEKTFAVEFNGPSQRLHVKHVMDECKKNSAAIQERLDITHILDYKKGKSKNFQTNKENVLNFPAVNMLQVKFSDGLSVTIVPQETQVYYYFSMKGNLGGKDMYPEVNKEFDDRIFKILEIINKL